MRTPSKELQEAYNEYEILRDKAEKSLSKLFENPTKEGLEKFSKYLEEQKGPHFSKIEKLIEN